jgi:ferritin-like metal-binding protein YciE
MSRDPKETIHSYVTDMLALEEHIEKALHAQAETHSNDHSAVAVQLREMHAQIERHIVALRSLDDAREAGAAQGVAEVVKRAGSMLAGLGAAAIDLIRSEKLPKNLRDDATAFSLAATGYLMLHTTAKSLGDARTAQLAGEHMEHYAGMIMRINHMIPATVLWELKSDDLPVNEQVLPEVLETYRAAWSN